TAAGVEALEERLPEVRPPRRGARAVRQPVVRPLEREDARTARRQVRRLERGLDRLRPRTRADRDAEVTGCGRGQPRQKPALDLRRVDIAHRVGERPGLLRDRRCHTRVRVTRRRHAEAGREVDVDVAIRVPHVRAPGLGPEDRRLAFQPRDVRRLDPRKPRGQLTRGRARHRCPELRQALPERSCHRTSRASPGRRPSGPAAPGSRGSRSAPWFGPCTPWWVGGPTLEEVWPDSIESATTTGGRSTTVGTAATRALTPGASPSSAGPSSAPTAGAGDRT